MKIRITYLLITCLFLVNVSFIPGMIIHSSTTHLLIASPVEREVDFKITYKVTVVKQLSELKIKMIIPANVKERQKIIRLNFSIKPDSIYTANNNSYALFKFGKLTKDFKIILKGRALIFNSIRSQADTAQTDMSKYLVAEKDIETNSDTIIAVARSLRQRSDIETILKTFDYVTNHIRYQIKDAIGAENVLKLGVGKCMDYSDLFVALLRANNIPAKSIFGMVVNEWGDNPLHAWPEAWLKKQGWVRFDPTTGNSEIEKVAGNYKMHIDNSYIALSEGRNDPELHANIYYCYCSPLETTNFNIKASFDITDIAEEE